MRAKNLYADINSVKFCPNKTCRAVHCRERRALFSLQKTLQSTSKEALHKSLSEHQPDNSVGSKKDPHTHHCILCSLSFPEKEFCCLILNTWKQKDSQGAHWAQRAPRLHFYSAKFILYLVHFTDKIIYFHNEKFSIWLKIHVHSWSLYPFLFGSLHFTMF